MISHSSHTLGQGADIHARVPRTDNSTWSADVATEVLYQGLVYIVLMAVVLLGTAHVASSPYFVDL